MKIIQVISSLGTGGAEKLVVELSNELSNEHTVSLLSINNLEDWMIFPKLLNKNVDLYSLRKKNGFNPLMYSKIFHFLRKHDADVVHIHLESCLNYFVPVIYLLSSFFPRTVFFYTIHNKLFSVNQKTFTLLEKINMSNLGYICISDSILNDFVEEFPSLNFSIIRNGCKSMEKTSLSKDAKSEVENFKFNKDTKVLLTVGRMDPQKNHEGMFEAMNLLLDENVILLVICNYLKNSNPFFTNLVKTKPKNVHLLGVKDSVSDYMANCDAFFLGSLFEGMPITVLEAMSMSLPIICTPAGGLEDVIKPNINGFVSSDFSPSSMVTSIQDFLSADSEFLNEICARNKNDFSTKYNIKSCSSQHIKLYNNLRHSQS